MNRSSAYRNKLGSRRSAFLVLSVLTIIFIINYPLKLYATASRVDFYSVDSPPPGIKSMEPLIGKWWNWWARIPSDTAQNWPVCIVGNGGALNNNQSIVFTGNVAQAVDKNVNAKNQKCEISSNQLLYLTVYPGECSAADSPTYATSPTNLLNCAQDSNKVMKLMQVKVDGKDVSSNIIRQSTSKPFNFILPADNGFGITPSSSYAGGNNPSMAENYFLFFKPLPIGDHTISVEVIRQPLQPIQPVEHDIAKWNIKVTG